MEQTQPKPLTGKQRLLLVLEGVALLLLLPVLLLFFLYKDCTPLLTWELSGTPPTVEDFYRGEKKLCFKNDPLAYDWSKTGYYPLLIGEGIPRIFIARVVDTTAPTAKGKNITIGIDEELTPDACIEGLQDAQPVGIAFAQEPPFHQAGSYELEILLEDLSHNKSSVFCRLTVLAVQPKLVIEAGDRLPPLSAFMPNETAQGSFVTDTESFDTNRVGSFPITLLVEGQSHSSYLYIQDTQPPELQTRLQSLKPGQRLAPEAFVASYRDNTSLRFSFAEEPDWEKQGLQSLSIQATDEGGNSCVQSAQVFISPIAPCTVEATGGLLTADMLGEDIRLLNSVYLDSVCCRILNVELSGQPCPLLLQVVDTAAPVVTARAYSGYVGLPVPPEKLVSSVADATEYQLRYAYEPDWNREGEQTVTLSCKDAAGNESRVTALLTLHPDTDPPELIYVKELNGYVGETNSYLGRVKAMDARDGELPVSVDISKVNPYQAGRYPISYTASDKAGNSTVAQTYIRLTQPRVTEEELERVVKELYDAIIREDMTMDEKAWAIFEYTNTNIRYRSGSDKNDWMYEAYRGITTGRGDCYTFCSVARALLERAGAKVMEVTRYGGQKNTRHWWLLVDIGKGYYHFDPINVGPSGYVCYMRTTEEVLARSRNFWSFNQSLYPATPTAKYTTE